MAAQIVPRRAVRRKRDDPRRLWSAVGLSFVVFFGAQVGQADAGALLPVLVQAYRERLDVIQSGADRLADRLPCLQSYAASLETRSDEREIALGEARRRETPLLAAVERLRSEQAGFEAEITAQKPALEEKRRRYRQVRKVQGDINVATQRRLTLLDDFEAALELEPLNKAMYRVERVLSAVEGLVGEERRILAVVDAELTEDVGRECSRS